MAKSKGRLLAELLSSDGKVKESKSALEISGGKIKVDEIPTIPNSKLANSGITIAGENTSLGGTVSLNTGHITEHTNFKYYTDARARASISATGSLSYNSTTGVMSFTMPAQNTGSITEGSNLYFTNARARAAISVSGNALSYNSSTGVITSNFEESPTFTGHVSVQGNLNVGNSSAGNLIFKRPSANYIWADQTSGYFIFGTNARGTSYANRAMALTADNDANFGRDVNVVRQVSAPIYYDSDNTARYFNGNGTSVFGHVTTSNITASGTHTFTANDVDFIVQDTTDTVTNYIWRHHGNSALYLGSQDAIVNIRSPLQVNGTQVFDTSRNMSNVGTISSGTITSSGDVRADTHFNSTDTNATLSATGSGNVYLRPNGKSSTSGQVHIATSGNATFAGSIIYGTNGKVLEIADAAIQWYSLVDSAYKQAKFRATDYQFKNGGNTPIMTINSAGRIDAASLYDSGNTSYYLDPATSSTLNNLDMRGTGTKLPAHAYSNTHDGTNVYWHVGTAAGSTNKVLNLRVYKSNNTDYTTHKFTTTGIEVAEALKIGTTTVIDSSRNITANSRLTFDYNDHYLEPGTGNLSLKNASNASLVTLGQASTFNGTVRVNSNVSGIGDIDFGKAIAGHSSSSPARITASSTGQLYIDSTNGQHLFLGWYNGSGLDVISEMNARFASYKDRNDTAYFLNPAGASLIRNLEIKGTTSDSSTDALHIRNSGGTTQSYFRNDGTVVIGGSQYLYVTAGGGAYFSNSIKARGGILNDQGDLTLNDNVDVTGHLKISGSGSVDKYIALELDGRGSAFTGSNNAFIFNGQGSTGDYLAGALYFQSRSNSVNREIGFITGTTPAKRLVINNSGITVTGTITGDITGSLSGTATQASNLNNHNTGNLSEGSNLYYTDSRVGTYLSNNGYATQSTIVAAITDSAPTTLDTLNELAAALGDDASFSTTVTNSIATKLPKAGGTITGNLTVNNNLYIGDGNDGYFYNDINGRTAFRSGDFYIQDTVTNFYNYATNQYYGDSSGDNIHFRGNVLDGTNWIINPNDMRSQRYYSSDNTSYYTDPSDTSVINKLMVNGGSNNSGKSDFSVGVGGNPQVSWNANQVQIGGTDMNWNGKINYGSNVFSIAGWDANIEFFSQGGSTSRNIVFKPSNAGTLTERLTIHGDNGAVIASSQMRAPIFYDSNNTVYYTNPAGQSFLSTASIGTTSAPSSGYSLRTGSIQMHGAGSLDYISQLHFNDNVRFLQEGNNSYLRYKSGHTTTGGIKYYNGSNAIQGYVYFDSAGFGLLSADGSWAVRTWNTGTHIYHGTRSPVYYDSDDTNYYVDPNHTTTSAKFAGNVEHKGLTMTSGSDVDQLYTVTVSAQLTTSWQDTGINGSDLSSGTYIVQIYVDSDVPRYHYQEFYSGVMSWYNGGTNSNEDDEITLHRAGHAPNDGNVFLKTLRHPSGGDNVMLQLRATHNSTSASNYIFKFRRMI